MEEAIKYLRLLNSYRQPPNHKQILTRVKLTHNESVHNTGATIINGKSVKNCKEKNAAHAL